MKCEYVRTCIIIIIIIIRFMFMEVVVVSLHLNNSHSGNSPSSVGRRYESLKPGPDTERNCASIRVKMPARAPQKP